MHNGMLNLRQEKMSKSVGNIRTLRSILDAHRPEALITAFLGSHYRSPLEFSEDLLEETEQQVDRLRNVFRELADRAAGQGDGDAAQALSASMSAGVAARKKAFDEALSDDLNTAAALAEVFGLAREVNAVLATGELGATGAEAVRAEMAAMVHVLGLDAVMRGDEVIPADVVAMAEERRQARASRDFGRADALRAAIAERGYEVRDVPDGFKIVAVR
jgi:cysteinyl-tRNA synthetase